MNQDHPRARFADEEAARAIISRRRSPLKFFLLVTILSIPFWLISALTRLELLLGLPVASLMACCPMIAAMILVYRENKAAGVVALLKRSFDFNRIRARIWYAPTLLLVPMMSALSLGVLRLTGTPVPDPQLAVLPTLLLCVMFFIGALGEDLGWSGYAIDPMQDRWGALQASLVLGAVWAVYHYIALVQAHRSVDWIVWWSVGTIADRVILVWLYNNTDRSVFATALFHMTLNVTWQIFPVNGSYFDPGISGLLSALVVVLILIIWEPRTLAQYRHP